MLGFVCFMCPGSFFMFSILVCQVRIDHTGLYNALNGLGGGGQIDTTTAANSNVAVYSTFAACAFFAGYVSYIFIPFSNLTRNM
jgi:hypothetical protein